MAYQPLWVIMSNSVYIIIIIIIIKLHWQCEVPQLFLSRYPSR